ncbi:MAG: sulfatase [Verrucomicrobia bacterium]|nr:sulfatase [Verrucomicrobiota bacterium]
MPYSRLLALLFSSALLTTSYGADPIPKESVRPNIILILVDDLGWTDLSCMGSQFYETPHIDRLAAQGTRFTQAYSACTVCSPTRAAVLTGRYPARLHLTDWISGHVRPHAKLKVPDWTMFLPHAERTIAEALKPNGYISASIGKWHLGGEPYWPETQGFDRNIGGYHRGQPPSYFAPYKIPTLPEGPDGEFLTDRESLEATSFIEANKDRPFFLYLPHYAVHTPIQAKSEVAAKYRAKVQKGAPHTNPTYAALIESVDDSVGRITQKLDELNLSNRTIIIFTSDNGGLIPITSNPPLRAGKGSAYEGGVRVPLIIKWPNVTTPGSVNPEPVISTDFFPTVLEMTGTALPTDQELDGESLVPLLKQSAKLQRTSIFWHYPHYHPGGATPYGAVRDGDYRLIEFYEDQHIEMFNLATDPSETLNIANQLPEKRNDLSRKLAHWRDGVKAQMPSNNPDYDPSSGKAPPWVMRSSDDGTILLHAKDASVHGALVRYEPQPHKNTLGYWVNASDSVSWDFEVERAGSFRVSILQGCGPRSGGSEVEFRVGSQVLPVTVIATKGFQDFLERNIGVLRFESAGRYKLTVNPVKKPGQAVMDLREVRLIPVR